MALNYLTVTGAKLGAIGYYTDLIELDKKNPNALARRGYHFNFQAQIKF